MPIDPVTAGPAGRPCRGSNGLFGETPKKSYQVASAEAKCPRAQIEADEFGGFGQAHHDHSPPM